MRQVCAIRNQLKKKKKKPIGYRREKQYSQIKSRFFENINIIHKPSVRLTNRKREKTQFTKMRKETRHISIDFIEITRNK